MNVLPRTNGSSRWWIHFNEGSTTPGNVGICFSGVGSRAFSAGLGQLQALEYVQLNGSSLLNQVRAMSTVSGGGWIGIPFAFLPSSYSDSDFLGTYTTPSELSIETINDLPPQGVAQYITDNFSIPDLAIQAVLLYEDGCASSNLWQVLMGQTFLQPFGLYVPAADYTPTTIFTQNAASLATYVTGPNLDLDPTASIVATPAGQQRPYLISLSSLSVSFGGDQQLALTFFRRRGLHWLSA